MNVDEEFEFRLKDLLHGLVNDMETMLETNLYRSTVVSDMHKKIDRAVLLTKPEESDTV